MTESWAGPGNEANLIPRPHPFFVFGEKDNLPYSGKLSREKTCANFEVLWLFAEVFSVKFRGVASFSGTSKQLVKVSPNK